MQTLRAAPVAPRDALDWEPVAAQGQVPLLLVRHGQTRANVERRFVGRTDVPLDDEGHRQAARLAARLKSTPWTALYASPLARARQTAEALGDAPTLDDQLMELHQGELEGLDGPTAFARFPEVFSAWMSDPASAVIPGGEALPSCQARGVAALTRIARAHKPGPPVIVVSHQLLIVTTLLAALQEPLTGLRRLTQSNTALNLLGWSEAEGLRVWVQNDRAHLDDPPEATKLG
ncbi:histidine phosphatase family protein [Myxococcota bacterium]|nr:histidine phosphatase family protein [Myxococcota bacterium]